MLGPTWILRSRRWAMTSPRNRVRAAAYCSKDIKSSRVNLCISAIQTVGHSQQGQWMRGRRRIVQPAFDLMSRHGAIAGVKVGAARLHALEHRLADFHGGVAK